MKCPFCKKALVAGDKQRYTNTADHVEDPNHEYKRPLHPTFKCDCEWSYDCFWDEQGGFYSGRGDTMKFSERKALFPTRACWPAIGSWDWWYSNQNGFSDKVCKWLFFLKGNKRFFVADRIARKIYKPFEPQYFAK